MHSKTKAIIKWTIIVISCLALTVFVPIVINECYKCRDGYITVWGGSEVLAYYGTILGAVGTGIGVFITIQYSQKQFREDTRIRNKPLFSINILKSTELFDSKEDRKQVIFSVGKNDINFSKYIDEEQKEIIINGGFVASECTSGMTYKQQYFCCIRRIQNIGLGCAVNVIVAITKLGSSLLTKTIPYTMIVNDSLDVVIIIPSDESIVGKYNFKISYYDVLGNRYVQDRLIEVRKEKRGFSVVEDSSILQRQCEGDTVIVV